MPPSSPTSRADQTGSGYTSGRRADVPVADHRSYSRAAGTALLGFIGQFLLGLTLFFYAFPGTDYAAYTAGVSIIILSFVWLMLAIVYDQYRRERLEALEAQSLDALAAKETSIFGGGGKEPDELRPQMRRLQFMLRWIVAVISLFIAGDLIGWGLYRLHIVMSEVRNPDPAKASEILSPSVFDRYVGLPHQGWTISLGLGVAVLGFVFARYTSGMSRQPAWSMLRAGSSAAIAASLMGLAMALAQFAEVLGAVHFGRWLMPAFAWFAVILGAEIILNFLLNLYRPRKPGEMPRAPVDSWLLGSIAAPDQIAKSIGGAISYQFGVDVTGSWAYRLFSRSIGSLALFAIAVVWLMTCFTIVGPDERGVIVRLGAEAGYAEPGFHAHWPWPITRVERTKTTQLRSIDLATRRTPEAVTHVLWTNDHQIKDETKILVRPSRQSGAGIGGEGDDARALMIVEVPMMYTIVNLQEYERLATPGTRDDFLRAIARREVTRYLSTLDEDELLGGKRDEANAKLRELVSAALKRENTGVAISFLAIEGVHPPKDTAGAFEQIVGDQLRATARIEVAERDASNALIEAAGSQQAAVALADEIRKLGLIPKGAGSDAAIAAQEEKINAMIARAGGKVGAELATARSDRWHSHMSQRGAAESYSGRLAAYRANKSLYFATAYFDTLRDMLTPSRLYIIHDGAKDVRINFDLKDLTTGGFSFDAPKTP